MAIRSLGNSKVRYAAVLKDTGGRAAYKFNEWYGNRGIWAGGYGGSPGKYQTIINYEEIDTSGNAADFGDLTAGRQYVVGASNGTRGVFMGGDGPSPLQPTKTERIDYITIGTTGNASDFGDLTEPTEAPASCSDGYGRGIRAGGQYPGTPYQNTIDFVTISIRGYATDFGNLATAANQFQGCNDKTRGVFAGGNVSPGTETNVIQYITTQTASNATDFGDLTVARSYPAGAASPTRGLFAGGFVDQKDEIDYITIATTGNAVDFGNLVRGKWMQDGAVSSGIRAVFGNGNDGSSPFGWKDNRIDYVTIATTGNSTDFGDASTYMCPSGAQSSTRGVWFGGQKGPAGPAWITTIQKIEISTLGNPSEFGDLTLARGRQSGLSNGGGGLV